MLSSVQIKGRYLLDVLLVLLLSKTWDHHRLTHELPINQSGIII